MSAIGTLGLFVPAFTEARTKMQIRYLHNLELTVFADLGHRLLELDGATSPYGKARIWTVATRIQMQSTVLDQSPARSRIYSVRAKQYVDGCYGLFRVARMALQRSLDPHACRPRLPLLRGLCLVSNRWVEFSRANIDNDLVFSVKLLFPLALDVHVCLVKPSLAEEEIFLYAVPLLLVKHALGQRVDISACLHRDIGDDEAIMVEWQVAVDRLGKDSVAVVEEEDGNGEDNGKGDELNARANLRM